MPEEAPKNSAETAPKTDKIIPRLIEEEMKTAYINYAMSVIVGRALPDVRDGLKPVHRRILYAMHDMGMLHNRPSKKCARIVGEVLGKYHPHGDLSVYDALVRMAQDFSLRYPLIKGQGNFGSIDGDSPAAMRYCLTGDTLVMTDKGLIPIKEISNETEKEIDLTIINYQGKQKKAVKFFNSGKHEIIRLITNQGYSLKGTVNHPVLCWVINEFGFPSIRWKLLGEITSDDYVIINRNFSLFNPANPSLTKYCPKPLPREKEITLPNEMTNSLAFVLGALVSEGSFHQKKIIFNNKDLEFYNTIKRFILRTFSGVSLYERTIAGDCRELELYHQKAVRFLANIGLRSSKAHEKEIPKIIFSSKKETIRYFLKALFEGDGSIQLIKNQQPRGKSIQLTYDSKSKKLLEQLKILLLNFGIITSAPAEDKRSQCYRLVIQGVYNVKLFKKEIGFFSKRKNSILNSVETINKSRMSKTDYIPYLNDYLRKSYPKQFVIKNNFDRYNSLEKNYLSLINILNPTDQKLVKWLLDQKYFFNKVKKIEKLSEKEIVYSLKVDSPCHSFVANGFINHNTEAKLSKLAEELLKDIDKNTVNFTDNFDGTLKEPSVLPNKLPNLLINGSSGIAVGMATNIPPHNLKETCTAIIETINNPEISTEELMQIIPGPDFPTGGEVICGQGLRMAYARGKGRVTIKSITEIEDDQIIIKEIPYQVNKSELIEQIAELVKDKKIPGIRNINDESDREGIRIVIDLRKDVDPNVVLNQLFNFSRLKTTFGITLLALVNNQPKVLGLGEIIHYHIAHRKEVITRRTQYELGIAQERAHVLEGLLVALAHVEDVVAGIKRSKTVDEAQKFLMASYNLTEVQAKAILDLRLQKLASLEQEKIHQEHRETLEKIKWCLEVLASEQKILNLIKEELEDIKNNYGDERKSKLVCSEEDDQDINIESLIEEDTVVVTITNAGYIKRIPLEEYRIQKRGGKGIRATEMKDEDFVENVYITSTHDYLLFFTDQGQMYWQKVYQLPEGSRQAKGKHISNLIETAPDEKINAIIPVKDLTQGYLFMATKNGTVKKTELVEFSNLRKGGIRAINLEENDKLVGVKYTDGNKEIILATKFGNANRFEEKDVRSMGRTAFGVRGIKLEKDDEVIGMLAAEEGLEILTLTEKGYGKRTPVSEYRLCNRGGKGVTNIKITDKNGPVKSVMLVEGSEELLIISKKGIAIRIKCTDISTIGRATQGVRIIRLTEDDQLAAAAKLASENGNGNNGTEPSLPPNTIPLPEEPLEDNSPESEPLDSEESEESKE